MFVRKSTSEIRDFVDAECTELQQLVVSLEGMTREAVEAVYSVRQDEIDQFDELFVHLAVVGLEISRSVYNSIHQGQLFAACVLLHRQVTIAQRARAFLRDRSLFEQWLDGKPIRDKDIESAFARHTASVTPQQAAEDEDTVSYLGGLVTMTYKSMPELLRYAEPDQLDQFFRRDIKRLLYENVSWFARFLASLLEHAVAIGPPVSAEFLRLRDDRLPGLQKRLQELHDEIWAAEST